jgi:predicted amidohydrolase YtcJ
MTEEEIEEENRTRARLAAEEALAHGITSFQDAGSGFGTIDFLRQLADEGRLPVRLYVMARSSNESLDANLDDYYMEGYADNHLTVRSIKRVIDGALGSHGAWLLEPYADLPSSTGLNTSSIESVERTAELAAEHGYQLNVHAIGDRANREVLDIYEHAFVASGRDDRRWRIEHAQHLDPDDLPRFAELGVIASMQGIHCTSDAPWVYRRLGEKRAEEGAYMWQDLWQSGAVVTNGTDVPVEDIDPIASYYATVSRRLDDGSLFFPEQALSREQALQSYTLNNAFAAFEEDIKGSITPGKLADITVLSKDILTVPEREIPSTDVLYTIVGGDVLYDAASE